MPLASSPVTLAVVGTGIRGVDYGRWVLGHPDRARVVAVAEPLAGRRELFAAAHGIPRERVFHGWEDLAAAGRVADAVIVTTQDRMHVDPVTAFAGLGYDILLEKPIAPTAEECLELVRVVEDAGVLLAVCHVLRYTAYTDVVKEVVQSGRLGEIASIQHLEPVGYWHQAHSYVRGAWRREDESTPMLLSKSCHDLDWLAYVTGRSVRYVSSFGGLRHFRSDRRPAGAGDRCCDCQVERSCPYSAVRLYRRVLRDEGYVWPVAAVSDGPTEEDLTRALREGPHGRCVYACDNDVVDHQVVAMEFDDGLTATFTMTAFTPVTHRRTRIFGSHGCLEGDGERVRVVDFRTDDVEELDIDTRSGATAADGHGGGDAGLMHCFIGAVATRDASRIRSGPRESLASHLTAFAAERARHEGRVVAVDHQSC